jgi:branched-subunit amino acid ABC-type transport system permease component
LDTLIQQIINGVMLGSIYALIALGYTMVYGILRIINFAHGDILMVGALTTLSGMNALNAHFPTLPPLAQLGWRCCWPWRSAPCWRWRSNALPTAACATPRAWRR